MLTSFIRTFALLFVVSLAVGCGSKSSSAPVTVTVTTASAAPVTTAESEATKKAAAARKLKAKAAAARRAKEVAAANALQAAKDRAEVAAANAWHKSYYGPTGPNNDVYYKYPTKPCRAYAETGCWHVQVVTAAGCRYLEVDINELRGGVVVGGLIANQLNVPPHTPVLLELDTDRGNLTGGSLPVFDCT